MEILQVAWVICDPYSPLDRGARDVARGGRHRDGHAVPERLLRRDQERVAAAPLRAACGGAQPRRTRRGERRSKRAERAGAHNPGQPHNPGQLADVPRHFPLLPPAHELLVSAVVITLSWRRLAAPDAMEAAGTHAAGHAGAQHSPRRRPRRDRLSSRGSARVRPAIATACTPLRLRSPARRAASAPVRGAVGAAACRARADCGVCVCVSRSGAAERPVAPRWRPPRACFPSIHTHRHTYIPAARACFPSIHTHTQTYILPALCFPSRPVSRAWPRVLCVCQAASMCDRWWGGEGERGGFGEAGVVERQRERGRRGREGGRTCTSVVCAVCGGSGVCVCVCVCVYCGERHRPRETQREKVCVRVRERKREREEKLERERKGQRARASCTCVACACASASVRAYIYASAAQRKTAVQRG